MAGENVKAFACPKCGASLNARGMGQTNTLICPSCYSAIDLEHPEYKILYTAQSKRKSNPVIPLGKRGNLRGDPWEVIGFLKRSDGSGQYTWCEYLLFNPYKGFRWLVESNGHWSFVTTTKSKPEKDYNKVTLLGQSFQHFLSGQAVVVFVLGEFYWRIKVGDKAAVSDFIDPPKMLSYEASDGEEVWSVGEYIESEVVQKSFMLDEKSMPEKTGVAANQPNPAEAAAPKVYGFATMFFVAMTILHIMMSATMSNRNVFTSRSELVTSSSTGGFVSEPFELEGGTTNLMVQSVAPLENNWLYLNYTLFNQNTGQTWEAGRELSSYSGYEDGEYWSEGSNYDQLLLPSIPSGTYTLTVTPEGGKNSASGYSYEIKLFRGVPYWGNYGFALALLLIYPAYLIFKQFRFEAKRWEDSDHPMFESGEDDEEDE